MGRNERMLATMPPPGVETVLLKLGVSLGLGLLVGLQRERNDSRVAGFRTFPLITVFGTLCALLSLSFGGTVVAGGLIVLGVMIVMGNLAEIHSGAKDPGLTTEAAMLVMFGIGAYLVIGEMGVAIVAGSAVAVLLFLKPQLHGFAHGIGERDFKAIMQLVVISLVILPVLPNRFFGPYGVLNPFHIWVMVVFIVGISLTGYVIFKLWGHRAGVLAGGVLGGLISSTATTASFSRRVRETPGQHGIAALVIILASSVSIARVLLVVGVRDRAFLPSVLFPLGIVLGVLAAFSIATWLLTKRQTSEATEPKNPCDLPSALIFGALYGFVMLAVAFAKEHLGEGGVYSVAVLSGLTDMDAITLSITELVADGKMGADAGWRAILAAALSNMAFKSGIAGVLGGWRLFVRVGIAFGVAGCAGIGVLVFWR